MAFDLLEGYEDKKIKPSKSFDLLEGYEETSSIEPILPKHKVETEITRANQNLDGISPEVFKKNVDSLYNIPQVPMPKRNNAGYSNSNGEFRENLPTFAENHPIISSTPEMVKQFAQRAIKSYPEFSKGLNDAIALSADKIKGVNPDLFNNPFYKAAKSVIPTIGIGEVAVNAANPISDFAKNNAQYWDEVSNKIQINPKYQGLEGLKSKETFLPTLGGEIGGQATNLLMAMGGGATGGLASKAGGLGKLGTGAATFAGTSIPNLAQEGQYLDKIEKFKQINGRMPNAEELKQIQNVALGEKAINTALESAADRLLFGKLFPEGEVSKGVKNIAKSMGQQGLTESLTETAQEGTSIGAENLLGLNQDNWQENLARAGEAGLLGGLTGSIIGGVSTAVSQPYDSQFPEKKAENKIEEIAPKTAQQIQENNTEPLTGKVENQYEDNAKVVFDGNKYEALTPEELENVKVPEEVNSNIAIDEDSAEALKGHIKKQETEDNGIVIDKNDAESLSGHVEKKPKQYKVVDGKTVRVDAEPIEEIKKIAPKTVESIEQVKNAENLQANETVGQEGNTIKNLAPNIAADKAAKEEQKALIKKCYEVLAQASGKKASYIQMTLNSNAKTPAGKKKSEKLREALLQSADTVDQSTIAGFEGYFGDIGEGNSSIIERALQILDGKYESSASKIENQYNEMGAEIENDINIARKKISEAGENAFGVYDTECEALINKYPKEDFTEELNKLVNIADDTVSKSLYNKGKGVENNERERSIDESVGNNREEISEYDSGSESGSNGTTPSESEMGMREESSSQVAIKGLEEESAKAVKKQQNEAELKEAKEKYSTTQDGKQNQMFNTEQFKDGQQMLFDTSDVSKEPEIKKSTYTMKSGKEKEIEYVEEIPEGYIEDKGATTAPKGYTWYHNNKSITSGERKRILVKDKTTEENSVVEKSEPKKKEVKKKETNKLEDSGEFLKGNRKQDTSLTWDDLKEMNDLVRAKNTTKARVYPKPTIEDLKSEGFTEFQAGIIQNVYNKINAKPAAGYDTIENQKQYVDTINEVMSKVKDYIKSHPDEFTTDLIAEAAQKYRSWSYDYNKSLFDVIFPDTENKKASNRYSSIFKLYPEYNRKALIIGGNKFTGALQLDNKTLVDIKKAIEDSKKVNEKGEKVKTEPWEKTFIILEPDRWNKGYAVANKKGKQVFARYETKEEAIAAAKYVYGKIEQMNSQKANFVRNHIDRRENNRDVTTEELQNAFGFRGVNFGNWATAKERQNFANFAYDSLYDLAELLNLPPKAISLNGQLGLAYGAQGKGGFGRVGAAHYIPEYKEINLTKEHGAGSLAHEWWHALDNYFGNQATKKEYSREWALSLTKGGELRPELYEVLENLQKQIKQSPFTEEDIKKRAEQLTIQTKARIKRYADSLKQDYAKSQNSAELHKIIDDLVENQEKYKTYSWEDLHEISNKFFKLVPSNRDTLTNRGKFGWLTGEITRLNDIEELSRKGANKSKYLENAEKIDGQGGGKYWSEDTELGARAFAAYIFDKMANQNIENRFLTRSGDGAVLNLNYFKELAEGEERESFTLSTTPKGEERERIFKAFDKLFDTIKTRETDKGVELYGKGLKYESPNDEHKFFLKNKNYQPNDIVAYGVDLATHPAYEAVKDFFRGCDDVPIRIANPEILKKYNADAYFNRNGVFISEDFDIPLIIHELTHYKDYMKNKGDLFFKVEQKIYNAIMKIDSGNSIVNKVKDILYRAASQEKIAYDNQDVAIKRLQGDKNARFRQVAKRTPSIIRGLIQIANGRRNSAKIGQNSFARTNAVEGKTEDGGRLFGRHTNGDTSKREVNKNTGDEIKQRGAINTLNKYNKEMADSVTDREYIVRGIEKVEKDIANMSEKEIEDILNDDNPIMADIQTVVLANNIKDSVSKGEVPTYKLNRWAVAGTNIGQAMQSRQAIALESVEEAVIKMHTYNTEKAPKAAKKLLKDADKIVNQIKKSNNEIEKEFDNWLKEQENTIKSKKKFSQEGDKLALLKAMEKYREKKALKDKKAQEKGEAKLAKQEAKKQKELEKEEKKAKEELEKERQALIKAMEKYRSTKERQAAKELERAEERKRKAVEKLIEERTIGWNKKKKADLIDNIMKLDENGGLTEDNVCKLINKMFGIKEVTSADIEELKKLEANIKNAKTQREEDVAKGFMQKYILENSVGATWWDKIDSIRYINMLGSTKSRLLDFASTGVYQAVRLADNASVLVLDKALTKKIFGTDRVTSGFYPVEYAKGFVQGVKEGYYDVVHGINTGRAGETARYDLNRANAFKYKPLKPLKDFPKFKQGVENSFSVVEKFVSGMVRIPDRAFFNGRYNASLIDQLKARGMKLEKAAEYSGSQLSEYLTNVATQEEIEQAVNEARENVFQRECAASMAAAKIRSVANGIVPKSGDILFPFIHTTSVISQDVAERIGLGFVKGLKQIHNIRKNGGSTGQIRDAYNSIAKSITGAIIIMLGVGARLAGKDDDNDKTYSDIEVSGEHNNALNIGKTSLNAKDIPFLTIPYNLAKALSSGNEEIIYKGILKAFDDIAEVNPIASSYKESISQAYKYKKDSKKDVLTEFIANSLYTPTAQIGQNAMLKDVRGIVDPYQRETYEPNRPFKTAANRFKNSTPFISKSLPVKYNAIGEPVKKNDGNNLVERVVSGLITGHKHIKEDETYDIYNKTLNEAYKDTNFKGKNNILMQKIKHSIDVSGQKYKMSAEEFSDFQKDYGRINYALRKQLLNDAKNGLYSDENFVKEVNEIQNSAIEAVKIMQLKHIPERYKNGNYKTHKYTIDILQNYDELMKSNKN